jgi:hypothetical protein
MNICTHPLLDPALLETTWPTPLAQVAGLEDLVERLDRAPGGSVQRCEQTQVVVRDLLRVGGFKPSGRSGQEIDVGGLICLHDGLGPCGGPVKDSQRTKTHDGTTRTLSIVWGTTQLPGRTEATARWYGALLEGLGAQVQISLPAVPRDPLG